MFRGFSGFFNKSNKDLRKKIYFTMMCLGIFCLGTTITIPWASAVYEELGFLEIFNVMSGGGLSNFSIFALRSFVCLSSVLNNSVATQHVQPFVYIFAVMKLYYERAYSCWIAT